MKYTEEQIKRMEERLASYMNDDRPVVNFSITGSLGDNMEDWTMPVPTLRNSAKISPFFKKIQKFAEKGCLSKNVSILWT